MSDLQRGLDILAEQDYYHSAMSRGIIKYLHDDISAIKPVSFLSSTHTILFVNNVSLRGCIIVKRKYGLKNPLSISFSFILFSC